MQAVQSIAGKENITQPLVDLTRSRHSQIQVAAVQKLAETAPEQFAEKLSGNWDKLSEPAQQAFIGSLGRDVSEEGHKILAGLSLHCWMASYPRLWSWTWSPRPRPKSKTEIS